MGVYYCFTHIRLNMLIFNSQLRHFQRLQPKSTCSSSFSLVDGYLMVNQTKIPIFFGISWRFDHFFPFFMVKKSREIALLPCPQVAYRVIFSQDTMGVVDRRDLLEVSGEARRKWIALWHGKALGLWENWGKFEYIINILCIYII